MRPFTIGWWCLKTWWIWVTPGFWIWRFIIFGFWTWRAPPEPFDKWWWSFASLRPRVRNFAGIWCWRCFTQTSKQSTTPSGDNFFGENSLHSCSSSLTWNRKQHHPKDTCRGVSIHQYKTQDGAQTSSLWVQIGSQHISQVGWRSYVLVGGVPLQRWSDAYWL